MKMSKKLKTIISVMMMVAMVITMLPKADIVRAADGMDINFHFYDKGQKYGGKVFLQYWQEGTATLSTEVTKNADWGVNVYPLNAEASEGDDWYGVNMKGSCEGFQFLDDKPNTSKNYTGSQYNVAMKNFKGDLYFMDGVWYTENPVKKADAEKFKLIEPKEEFYLVGEDTLLGKKWDNTDLTHKFSKNADGTFSYELKNVAAGSYQCKALKDPENFAWDYAWTGIGTTSKNCELVVKTVSDIIFTLDPADTKYELKYTIIPKKELSGLKSPVYNDDGTVTFLYESDDDKMSIGVKGNLVSTQKKSMIKAELGKNKLSNGSYVYIATSSAITAPGVYSYSFYSLDEDGAVVSKLGDPASTTQYGDGGAFVRNPVVDSKGLVKIFYPYDGAGAEVYYKSTSSSNSKQLKEGDKVTATTATEYGYKTVPMTIDSEFVGKGMYSAEFFDKDGTYEYVIVQNNKVIKDAFNYGKQQFVEKDVDEVALGVKSPQIITNADGSQTVKFMYYDATKEVTQVQVAGEFTDWQSGAVSMTEDTEHKGVWSYETKTLKPGAYQYKFILNGGSWTSDPLCKILYGNDGNSIVVVPGLKLATDIQIQKGTSVDLPAKAQLFTNAMAAADAEVTYALKDSSVSGVTLSGNKLTVAEDFAGEDVALVIKSGDYSLDYNVSVVGQMFTYTIHYYGDNVADYANRDMWIWPQVGKAYNTGYVFNKENYTDPTGRVWATAVYSFPTDAVNMIVRSKGAWDYQEGQRSLNIKAGATEGEFWVLQEASKAFDTYADEFDTGARYVVVEYERANGDYDDWNLYTWNATAKYNQISNFFTKNDEGKYTTTFTIAESTDTVNFLIRRGTPVGDDWSNIGRDVLGDRAISAPLNQRVVKVKLTEGQSEVEYLPYSKGYDLDPNNSQIKFYYRDEDLYLKNTQTSLKKVVVNVAGKDYTMKYNKTTQRYEYNFKASTAGNYEYFYKITDAKGNTTTSLDVFNSNMNEAKSASVVTYKNLSAKVTVTANATSIYAGKSATLNVAIDNKDVVVEDVYADLSALGGKSKVEIEKELMSLTFGVTDTTSLGSKTIPVTVVDQFNKKYTAKVKINVVNTPSSEKDWDESVIYFMVTDRFNDGNTSNNDAYGVGDYDVKGPSSYHGGDFAGVTAKLDYLKDLGVNTIWITPIVENIIEPRTSSVKDIKSCGYHGYWASDFEALNKHLGTVEELHTMIDEAHSRGIKIMVDVVLNHAGYDMDKAGSKYEGMFHDNVSGNDVLEWQDGLPDFATENSAVREKLINWQKAWVSDVAVTAKGNTIDYFRVDTVKHVDTTTWSAFKNALTTVNPEFKMIGEYYGASATEDYGMLNSGRMDSLLDFNFNDMATNFVNGQLESTESQMVTRNTKLNSVGTLGSFLNSHDEDGFKFNLAKTYSAEQADALAKVAASLSITAKGQPIIYYGEEIGLSGENNYPYQTNRYDMKFDNLSTTEQSMLEHYKKMLALRNQYSKVFAKGTRKTIAASDADKYVAFERSYQGKNIVVALNIEDADKNVQLVLKDFAGQLITDEYTGQAYEVAGNGKVTITIPANSKGGTVVLTCAAEKTEETATAAKLKAAKTNKQTATFNAADALGNTNAIWSFAYSDLKRVVDSKLANTALTCTVTDANSVAAVKSILAKDSNNSNGAVVKFSQAGTLAVNAKVKVFLKAQSAIPYDTAVNVYRLNGSKLEEVAFDTAKVSKDGWVTLHIAQGGTYVLLSKKASSKVVTSLIDNVKVSLSSTTLKAGKTASVSVKTPVSIVKVSKFTETNLLKLQSAQVATTISYASSNSKVAKISSSGKITAVKKGTCKIKITVRLSDGQKKVITKTVKVK